MRGADRLAGFVARNPRLVVLTGAGCSTSSGIPDYRDADGQWKHARPVQFRDFVTNDSVRRRYWAKSMIGWPRFHAAVPNAAHTALGKLEASGHITTLITQNVDGLHQKAGSRHVIDLHGRLDSVICLQCPAEQNRHDWQQRLRSENRRWDTEISAVADAPDGDALLEGADYSTFVVPPCPACGGMMKPKVVFFGERVPVNRAKQAMQALDAADALLVVGSSLVVYSGYRFALRASAHSQPVALLNRGYNRADDFADLKIDDDCGHVLGPLADSLTGAAQFTS